MDVNDDGLIYAPHRISAIFASGCLALFVGWPLYFWLTTGRAAWREPWPAIGFSGAILISAVVAFRSWSDYRRFGSSRLVPVGPDVRPGETLSATLEAAARLAYAREVRFELVEMHRSSFDGGPYGEHVRATVTVPLAAFQVMPGLTRIPASLPVPADGWASFKRKNLGISLFAYHFIGMRETEHAWEVRAAAEVEGAPYRARFRVTVAPVTPLEPAAPYAPRPIVIPPSDKPPSTSTVNVPVPRVGPIRTRASGYGVFRERSRSRSRGWSVRTEREAKVARERARGVRHA